MRNRRGQPQHDRHVFDTLVEVLGLTTLTRTDLLVITASNGENLKLAKRFLEHAQGLGLNADLLDLTLLDLPLFTPRTKEQGMPTAIAPLQTQLVEVPRW